MRIFFDGVSFINRGLVNKISFPVSVFLQPIDLLSNALKRLDIFFIGSAVMTLAVEIKNLRASVFEAALVVALAPCHIPKHYSAILN